jgi:hypothetical protein
MSERQVQARQMSADALVCRGKVKFWAKRKFCPENRADFWRRALFIKLTDFHLASISRI